MMYVPESVLAAISKRIEYAMKNGTDTIIVKLEAFKDASVLAYCSEFINVSANLHGYPNYQDRILRITGISNLKVEASNVVPSNYTRLVADSAKHILAQ